MNDCVANGRRHSRSRLEHDPPVESSLGCLCACRLTSPPRCEKLFHVGCKSAYERGGPTGKAVRLAAIKNAHSLNCEIQNEFLRGLCDCELHCATQPLIANVLPRATDLYRCTCSEQHFRQPRQIILDWC